MPLTGARRMVKRRQYLDSVDPDLCNPSDYALHLTRRARGLPLWYSLATHGTDAYATAVARTLDIARTIADGIADTQGLELLLGPQLSVILFRPTGIADQTMGRLGRGASKVRGSVVLTHNLGGAKGVPAMHREPANRPRPGSCGHSDTERLATMSSTLELLDRLVAFDTVSSKSNLPIADFIQTYLMDHGFEVTRVPGPDRTKSRIVRSKGLRPQRRVVVCSHGCCPYRRPGLDQRPV